jgi:deaminated glutathione amidase
MRVAIAQAAASTDKATNLTRVRKLLAGAAARRPHLLIFPEAIMYDFGDPNARLAPVAEPIDGPFVTSLSELARTYRIALIAGMFERSEQPDLAYNTVVAIDSDGSLLARYRKIHLYDSFGNRESDRLKGGDLEPAVVKICGMSVGLLTCYDLRFPELARVLVEHGAEVIAVPAAWMRGSHKEDHWETLLRARAIENTCFVAAAGQSGPSYIGCSMVVDPIGVPVVAMGAEEGIAVADVERSRLEEVRTANPALEHQRFRVVPRG